MTLCRWIPPLPLSSFRDPSFMDKPYLFKSKIFEHAAINGMKLIFPNADY